MLLSVLVPTLLGATWFSHGHRLGPSRASAAAERNSERLRAELADIGLRFGAPVHVRIFKQPATLELWVEGDAGFTRFRTYPICTFSGELGPKTAEGDRQAPEGIYEVWPDQLNPRSRFHLAFNLGYPNAVERARGWTGSALMVHGECASIGCYAMGNPAIEEIYVLVAAALDGGQSYVPVHAFPFPLTADALAAHSDHASHGFWTELAPFFDAFDARGQVLRAVEQDGRYTAGD